MKIAVVGLGAVGGLIAARLAGSAGGHSVSALARGATLAAVRAQGLQLRGPGDGHRTVSLSVSDDAHALGPQDLVVIALKGQALPAAVAGLAPMIGPHTLVLPAMNGVPWWFLQAAASPLPQDARHLDSVDPGGHIGLALPLSQVLGCVVHLAASQRAPGLIQHNFGERLIVGEPQGGHSARVHEVVVLLAQAGFQAEASPDIRREIWFKLWGNLTTNPVSALTGATADRILDDPLVRRFMLDAMAEAATLGQALGCPIGQSGEDRLAVTRELGAFKTSMLQDTEAGRPLEIDAIVTAVHEIGRKLQIATPHIDTVLGLVRLMARSRGLYPDDPTQPRL